jgi:HSP20 family protein
MRRSNPESTMLRPFGAGPVLRPFALLRDMTDWMDQFFEGDLPIMRGERMWQPAVEVREHDNQILISADLPGIDPKDVKIEAEDNTVVIQGERKREHQEDREGYRRSERFYGSFFRAIPLPEYAKIDDAKAEFRNGVLEVTVPLDQQRSGRKQIPIQAAQSNSPQRQSGAGSSHERSSQERQAETSSRR